MARVGILIALVTCITANLSTTNYVVKEPICMRTGSVTLGNGKMICNVVMDAKSGRMEMNTEVNISTAKDRAKANSNGRMDLLTKECGITTV